MNLKIDNGSINALCFQQKFIPFREHVLLKRELVFGR